MVKVPYTDYTCLSQARVKLKCSVCTVGASLIGIISCRRMNFHPLVVGFCCSLINVVNFFSCWRIIRDVLEGLVYIHRKGLAHADVKAGNVLLDDKGRAKLADFGNVKKVASYTHFCCLIEMQLLHYIAVLNYFLRCIA